MVNLLKILKVFLAIALLFVAFNLRAPFLPSIKFYFFLCLLAIDLALIFTEIKAFTPSKLKKKFLNKTILVIACLSLLIALTVEIRFNLLKQSLFHAKASQIEKLGQHFIIGYRDSNEVKKLVSKKAIGGIFLTTRNIRNKTQEDIKQEISALQEIRRSQGLSPLWIATDQEGGVVSRLSPPLTRLPQLSKVISESANIEQAKEKVIKYAKTQASELSTIGINLNFAPVLDLNKGVINPNDKFSKIYKRAISSDKEVVEKFALLYCQTLEANGVRCTIKHFPGLGRVETDTHLESAELHTSVNELAQDDWVPFRTLMSNSHAFTMLGHAKLMAIDAKHPVSFSQRVISMIRNDWQQDGVLITDDFCMYAVYNSQDGLRNATVKALNAGADLILIAYDHDLYYEAMDALIKADNKRQLENELLIKSSSRLEQTKKALYGLPKGLPISGTNG
ncbi:glycoside hydrolase family 3 protein [Coleofasciculus sp. FACHB-129]|uniref:glycoside hydrolase family 3 protein n=1 Tax=Cyanophyceae TaxID=3028117 RepID=UPI001687E784|nr:glycoside hydrolase family 3 protein [Coleofasciculus sp. FACHB-129]MBD1896084.1 glycoside hydrolase family 3 protein [Coleofasciculus sp. FACHB-129]